MKEFIYKNRRCVIIYLDMVCAFKRYHNGYIEIKWYEKYIDIGVEEITYKGNLKFASGLDVSNGKSYIGFDTMHLYNTENPGTQSVKHVSKICKKIIDELDDKTLEDKIMSCLEYLKYCISTIFHVYKNITIKSMQKMKGYIISFLEKK